MSQRSLLAQLGGDELPQEIATEADDTISLAKKSLDFLAGIAMPLVYAYKYPPIFIGIWKWLTDLAQEVRIFPQLALGLPRGFGKTALIKLYILYCILFTRKRFILILCENEKKAINILTDVCDMLAEPNIKSLFGDYTIGLETDQQALKKFGYRGRDIIIMAAGAGTGIRGITIKNQRPDVMIFDDIQSREVADSEVQSLALERWMYGTAMKAKSPQGCMFLFIANMYPTKWSILRRLKTNPNWVKFIVGGILEDGTSLWEDLQPIDQLVQEFENDLSSGHPEIFYAEVLNDENAASNRLLDVSKIPERPYVSGDIPGGKFIVIDPSGDRARSDCTAIGYFEVYDGKPCLIKLINERLSPGETIHRTLALAMENGVHLVACENIAYQDTLLYWFRVVSAQLCVEGIEFVGIHSGGGSKNSRIVAMFKSLMSGEVVIGEEPWAEVILQAMQFNALKRDNVDDILDLLCYANKVLELFEEHVIAASPLAIGNDTVELLPEALLSEF